jgi:hypothetical protein
MLQLSPTLSGGRIAPATHGPRAQRSQIDESHGHRRPLRAPIVTVIVSVNSPVTIATFVTLRLIPLRGARHPLIGSRATPRAARPHTAAHLRSTPAAAAAARPRNARTHNMRVCTHIPTTQRPKHTPTLTHRGPSSHGVHCVPRDRPSMLATPTMMPRAELPTIIFAIDDLAIAVPPPHADRPILLSSLLVTAHSTRRARDRCALRAPCVRRVCAVCAVCARLLRASVCVLHGVPSMTRRDAARPLPSRTHTHSLESMNISLAHQRRWQ